VRWVRTSTVRPCAPSSRSDISAAAPRVVLSGGALDVLDDRQTVREALARLSDDDGDGRRRRLDRLTASPGRSTVLTVVVALSAIGLLVLPTVILVVPWLGRAVSTWPLRVTLRVPGSVLD
jgi:hypothetical protein